MGKFKLNFRRYKVPLIGLAALLLLFQNCQHPYDLKPTDPTMFDSEGRRLYKGQLTVGASKDNPPLNLIFVVDNSASMLAHQIDLGTAFSRMFTDNINSLANFESRLFIYSTASTTNNSTISQVPTRNPASISSVPAPSDTASIATVPGAIFGTWNNLTGSLGVVPYAAQISPAAVLDLDPDAGSVTSFVSNPKKGTLSDSEYNAKITNLTNKFKKRLAYLDPTSQLSYGATTDVSSGLCTISRLMRHPEAFHRPGDAAAFIIVSDDNDRLNVRNPNNNQCIDSVVGSSTLIDGYCGHYDADFNYNSTSVLNYRNQTKIDYESGTKFNFSYGETCTIRRNIGGYNYSYTYTAVRTQVTYEKCTLYADGMCQTTAPGTTAVVNGNYVGAGGTCTALMADKVSNPTPTSTFVCANADLPGQVGASGIDTDSTGASCSPSLIASLTTSTRKDIACTITSVATTTISVSGPQGYCASYCSSPSAPAGCTLLSTTTNTANGSFSLDVNGLTCASTCPSGKSSTCGTGTIDSYLKSTYGSNTTCSKTAQKSTLQVNTGVNSDGTVFGCSSPLNTSHIVTLGTGRVCETATSVAACIASLQTGTNTLPSTCVVSGYNSLTAIAAAGVSCSTACSASSEFCPIEYTNVQNYFNKLHNGYCTGATAGGPKTLTLKFKDSIAPTASCESKCSDTKTGACDASGFGASDGATVNDFIKNKSGVSCTATNRIVRDTSDMTIDATTTDTNPATTDSVCTLPASPFFFATSGVRADNVVNYVAGNSTHKASDFRNHIVSQADLVFGTNNKPALAVITKMPGDYLPGTDEGTEYRQLATDMGSTQTSSILGDYGVALTNISDFIVKSTKNSYSLPISPTMVMVTVSVLKSGSTVAVPLDPSLWTWAGSTLSISDSAGLAIGDQILYQYRNP